MEKPKRPYSLFKRPTAKPNAYIYYCRFRDENGDYMSPIPLFSSPRPLLGTGLTKGSEKARLFSPASAE